MFPWSASTFYLNQWIHRWIPPTKPVTRSFDVFFDLRLNKRLNKQLSRRWFETPSRSLWRHSNDSWYTPTGLRHRDGCRCHVIIGAKSSAITMLTQMWFHYPWHNCHATAIKQTIIDWHQTTPCFRGYWRARHLSVITRYVNGPNDAFMCQYTMPHCFR